MIRTYPKAGSIQPIKCSGFTLIELMIVIGIMGLLIGVGTIAWAAMVKAGNEAAATQSIDNIRKFQAQYAYGNNGGFATLDQLVAETGLDEAFGGDQPVVNGYRFSVAVEQRAPGKAASYTITAEPDVPTGAM